MRSVPLASPDVQSATPLFPFADVEPAFLLHDAHCPCLPCQDEREAAEFLACFERNAVADPAEAFDDTSPCDPDAPAETDRDWWIGATRFEPSAADLALEIAAIEADLAAWHERFNRDQFEAGMDRGWPEHGEHVEMRGTLADSDPTLFL